MNIDSVMYGGIEINDDKKYYIDEESKVGIPKDLRYAKVIVIPEVGSAENPPVELAFRTVKFEANKVAFKYGQEDHWDYYYGMLADTTKHKCDLNGKPGVLIIMPYSTKNEELAKSELTKYVSEITMLCGLERSVLYFNLSTAVEVVCHYTNNDKKGQDTFESYEAIDHVIHNNVSCDLESTTQAAAKLIQPAIDLNPTQMTHLGVPYIEAGAFFYNKGEMLTKCIMFAPSVLQCNHKEIHDWPIGDIFEKSIFNALTNSKLIFKNYTVL